MATTLNLGSRSARLILAAVMLSAAVGALWAPVAAQAAEYCPKVQMFQAVGSGNRGNADITDALRDEILRPERAQNRDPDLFSPWRVDYPAVSVKSWTGLGAKLKVPGAYHKSVVKGKDWLRTRVKRKIDNCGGRTLIVLSGYSQGAQVVGDVYQELERNGKARHIFGVVLFGDPYFNPYPGGRGSSMGKWRHNEGVPGKLSKQGTGGALGRRPTYKASSNRVRSYCHKTDPVCQAGTRSSNPFKPFQNHENYAKTGPGEPGEATDAGRWLSTELRKALPPPPPPAGNPPPPPPVGNPPPPPPPDPKPYAGNLVVVDYGGGHVGVAFDVGWQAGRDPVTCHTFRNGVEIATDQCGTRSSKQFYGVPAGTHSFYATVSDRFGVYSDPTNTVVTNISGSPPPPPPPPPPQPTASNLRVVVYGGGHVGVAFDVGWQAGRDPVTCHTFRDNVEVATDQCGTSSSKQFYGVPAGTHSWYATVSDRFGVYSNPTNTVTVYSP